MLLLAASLLLVIYIARLLSQNIIAIHTNTTSKMQVPIFPCLGQHWIALIFASWCVENNVSFSLICISSNYWVTEHFSCLLAVWISTVNFLCIFIAYFFILSVFLFLLMHLLGPFLRGINPLSYSTVFSRCFFWSFDFKNLDIWKCSKNVVLKIFWVSCLASKGFLIPKVIYIFS